MATLASDAFTRTVASGWATADAGGAWTTSNDGSGSSCSVNGTQGVVSDLAGSTVVNRLASVSNLSTEILATVSLPVLPNAGSAYFRVSPRSVSDTPTAQNSYATVVQITAAGVVNLGWTVNGGTTTFAGTSALTAYTPGQQLTVRAQTIGANPTTIRARVWVAGSTEPSTWLINATDSTPGLQAAAPVSVQNYLSSAATNGPLQMLWDNVLVSSTTANPITLRAATANAYIITATSAPQNGGSMTYSIAPTTGTSVLSPGVFSAPVPTVDTQVTYAITATETYGPAGGTSTEQATTAVTLDGASGSTSTTSFATLVRVNGAWQ